MFEDDFILRTVRQIAELAARLLGKVEEGEKTDDVEDELDGAYRTLFGPKADLIRRLDPATVAHMCRTPEQLGGVAELCRVEAALFAREGDEDEAERLLARADDLARLAQSRLAT